jgi:excisionase family DNA binding protein
MKRKTIDLHFAIEVVLRGFVREFVHEELCNLPDDLRESVSRLVSPGESGSDELLTVGQVADALQVIPATVRTWIQSGALKASRPGNGSQPGRTYRVRRTDLNAFVAASQSRPASVGGATQARLP